MSLKQDPLSDSKQKKSSNYEPKHKYLADSINLESYKWASIGIESLKNEYRSAKSPAKREKILNTLNAARVRAELESKNPKVGPERSKELKLMRMQFIQAEQELTQKKKPKPKAKATPKPKSKNMSKKLFNDLTDSSQKDVLTTLHNTGEGQTVADVYLSLNIEGKTRAANELARKAKWDPPIKRDAAKEWQQQQLEKQKKRTKDYDDAYEAYLTKSRSTTEPFSKSMFHQLYVKDLVDVEDIVKQERPKKKPTPQANIDVESYERGLEITTKDAAQARADLKRVSLLASTMGVENTDDDFREEYLKTFKKAIGKTKAKVHAQKALGITPDPADLSFLNKMESPEVTKILEGMKKGLERKKRREIRKSRARPEDKKPLFSERPKEAKSFSDLERPASWEVIESEFITDQKERKIKSLEHGIEYRKKELAKLGPRAKNKREEITSGIAWQEKILGQLKEDDTTFYDSTWRREYTATIKKAISKGKPVPQEVINQRPEFKLAETARERYEKGLHTSFANVSIAINESMKKERGFKVKRQDGKEITDEQIAEITRGVNEVESVTGPLKGLFEQTDITIAHTSGKHPFLSKSGGVYSSSERTVTTGVDNKFTKQPIPSMAHEFGHWLDIEAGIAVGALTTEHTRKRSSRRTRSLAAHDSFRGDTSLITNARLTMRDRMEVSRLMKVKLKSLTTKEEKGEVEEVKVVLGPYWNAHSEIWARLVEQYISDELKNQDYQTLPRGRKDGYISVRTDYTKRAAYWDQDVFDKMKPDIQREIEKRIKIIETGQEP